jgi:acetyl/propionyl-CoA carboxylase alpha subunit
MIEESLELLKKLNPHLESTQAVLKHRAGVLQKVLVCNRSEIAKRAFLCLREEGIRSVAVVTDVDMGQTWYESADEIVLIGDATHYTRGSHIIAAALLTGANGIFPGYGFLAESRAFAEMLAAADNDGAKIIFIGPTPKALEQTEEKYRTLELAKKCGIPVFQGSSVLKSYEQALEAIKPLQLPVIVKLNAGGGGKGMGQVYNVSELKDVVESCQRVGRTLYKDDSFFLEEFIEEPAHFEVQVFNEMAIGIRKCAVQRRNQKIIEETGERFLDHEQKTLLYTASENLARNIPYAGCGSGTVEYLYNAKTGKFGLLEVNPRIQVEHPVTEQALDIDLVKWQILQFDGREEEIPFSETLAKRYKPQKHAIECRLYAEDPENNYAPSPGRLARLILPTFNGIRCDMGYRPGDRILQEYDPMIGKIIATGNTREEALVRMQRALNETYVAGPLSNVPQLTQILNDERFKDKSYTNRLLTLLPLYSQQESIKKATKTAAICGAFDAFLASLAENSQELVKIFSSLTRDLLETLITVPQRFEIEINEQTFPVDFLILSPNNFVVYVDGKYDGRIQYMPQDRDNNWIILNDRAYSVRANRRSAFNAVRVKSDDQQVNYYRMVIHALATGAEKARPGLMRVPFASRFVKFCEVPFAVGMQVKKGQPLVVIEAMKMESTLTAPVDGTIEKIIEDGDLSKLQLSKTADGLIVGRPLREDEFLILINSEGNS